MRRNIIYRSLFITILITLFSAIICGCTTNSVSNTANENTEELKPYVDLQQKPQHYDELIYLSFVDLGYDIPENGCQGVWGMNSFGNRMLFFVDIEEGSMRDQNGNAITYDDFKTGDAISGDQVRFREGTINELTLNNVILLNHREGDVASQFKTMIDRYFEIENETK